MRITPQDFDTLAQHLRAFMADRGAAIAANYRAAGLSDTRRRWDILWASGFDTRPLYRAGLNDDHIDTALRRILA